MYVCVGDVVGLDEGVEQGGILGPGLVPLGRRVVNAAPLSAKQIDDDSDGIETIRSVLHDTRKKIPSSLLVTMH